MPIGPNSMPNTYKSWANGYKSIVNLGFKKGKDHRTGVISVEKTENWEDKIVEIGTVGNHARWLPGEAASQGTIKEVYNKTFTQLRYGKEVPFDDLATRFQGKDVRMTEQAMKSMGRNAYREMQMAPFSILNSAFADTNPYLSGQTGATVSALGPDGKRFASTLHPCSPTNTTTWSNVLADNAAVSEASLKAHIENIHNQLDDQGNQIMAGDDGYIWLVPLQKFPDAKKIVGSSLEANTTDNNMNVYKGAFDGRPIEVRWVPWLSTGVASGNGSTTAHFLLAKDAVEDSKPIVMLVNEDFTPEDYYDERLKTAFIRSEYIYTVGFVSGRGFSCSQGTGTGTYTA